MQRINSILIFDSPESTIPLLLDVPPFTGGFEQPDDEACHLLAIVVLEGSESESDDLDGALLAGLYGWVIGDTYEVRSLWVRADSRGKGLGSRMLFAATVEARNRGCRQMLLGPYSDRATGLFQERGERFIDQAKGAPVGHRRHVMI